MGIVLQHCFLLDSCGAGLRLRNPHSVQNIRSSVILNRSSGILVTTRPENKSQWLTLLKKQRRSRQRGKKSELSRKRSLTSKRKRKRRSSDKRRMKRKPKKQKKRRKSLRKQKHKEKKCLKPKKQELVLIKRNLLLVVLVVMPAGK